MYRYSDVASLDEPPTLEDLEYDMGTIVTLEPGDLLILPSDGIIEAADPAEDPLDP